MDSRARYYVGLATTFHEPAVAIVDHGGRILFAEALERPCQEKRGLELPADHLVHIAAPLRQHCEPDSDIVVATSWSGSFRSFLGAGRMLGRFGIDSLSGCSRSRNRSLLAPLHFMLSGALIDNAQRRTGLGVLNAASEILGHRRVKLRRYDHHLTHAAHACFTSPFEDAVCAVVDGMGEFGSYAFYLYRDGRLRRLRRHVGLESLGFFYGLLTDLCGFSFLMGEEGKVMGLAGHGRPNAELASLLRAVCSVREGRIRVPGREPLADLVKEIDRRVGPVRGDPMHAADLARAGQVVFEECMSALLRPLAESGISANLVLAGGCALNSSYNGRVLEETGFQRLYVPAAPADDGNAVGAALLARGDDEPQAGWKPGQHGDSYPFLGSSLSGTALARLRAHHPSGHVRDFRIGPAGTSSSWDGLSDEVARLLAAGRIVAWVQGRAEFGPRALGNRSILADPRDPATRDRLNKEIKYREPFRPFAPSILDQHGCDYFEAYRHSPYMECALRFRASAAAQVPAVVHADGTGRLQSVTRDGNPRFYSLIEAFRRRTGVPLLLNTSCNRMQRPMIHSVEDAIGLFYTSGLDALVLEDILIEKTPLR